MTYTRDRTQWVSIYPNLGFTTGTRNPDTGLLCVQQSKQPIQCRCRTSPGTQPIHCEVPYIVYTGDDSTKLTAFVVGIHRWLSSIILALTCWVRLCHIGRNKQHARARTHARKEYILTEDFIAHVRQQIFIVVIHPGEISTLR